jgi:aminoglycoside 6'-N-acetyltransferase
VIASDGELAIRLMRDADDDYERMSRWLSNPRVLEYYEGRDQPYDEAAIRAKFGPRVMQPDGVTPCIIEWAGEPVGYVQFYSLEEPELTEYELAAQDSAFGFDLFIGETAQWGRGIGTRAASLVIRHLFGLGALTVTADPRVSNPRAIRVYEKAGMAPRKLLPRHELHEGAWHDGWLMAARSDRV